LKAQNYGNYLRFQSFQGYFFIFYVKWQNCLKFEPKPIQNAQFKATSHSKKDLKFGSAVIFSRRSRFSTHWSDCLGGG
jgi:hypothetical protein